MWPVLRYTSTLPITAGHSVGEAEPIGRVDHLDTTHPRDRRAIRRARATAASRGKAQCGRSPASRAATQSGTSQGGSGDVGDHGDVPRRAAEPGQDRLVPGRQRAHARLGVQPAAARDHAVLDRAGGDHQRRPFALDPRQRGGAPHVALGVRAPQRRVDDADRRGRAPGLGELDEPPAARTAMRSSAGNHCIACESPNSTTVVDAERGPRRRPASGARRRRRGSRPGTSGRDRRRRRAATAAAPSPTAGSPRVRPSCAAPSASSAASVVCAGTLHETAVAAASTSAAATGAVASVIARHRQAVSAGSAPRSSDG